MTARVIAEGNEWRIVVEDTPSSAGVSESYTIFCRNLKSPLNSMWTFASGQIEAFNKAVGIADEMDILLTGDGKEHRRAFLSCGTK